MRELLDASGYPVPRTDDDARLSGAELIAENLSSLDRDFEVAAGSVGLPDEATATVAVLDDGIAFGHPALAE